MRLGVVGDGQKQLASDICNTLPQWVVIDLQKEILTVLCCEIHMCWACINAWLTRKRKLQDEKTLIEQWSQRADISGKSPLHCLLPLADACPKQETVLLVETNSAMPTLGIM